VGRCTLLIQPEIMHKGPALSQPKQCSAEPRAVMAGLFSPILCDDGTDLLHLEKHNP
jgi:hypothetical protein